MNGKERIARAMRHEYPDRVPVMCQLALGHYFINMRDQLKPHEIWFTSEGFTEALLTMRERYHFDGILINIPGRDPNWQDHVQRIEEDAAGVETITFKDGLRVIIPPDDNALLEPNEPAKAPPPDFMTFDPDTDFDRVDDFPRYTWGAYHTPQLPGKAPGLLATPPAYFGRTIKQVQAAVGETISIHGEVYSPFTHLMELFSYQNALMLLVMDPARAKAILQRLVDSSAAWGVAQAGLGVDAVLLSSAFAGGSFISPQMYADFVVPYERQVVDAIHAKYPEMTVYTHTCGMLDDRLELMLETNTQGVDTLDPPPLGNTTLADAKVRIGDRAFIKGNMNAVEILDDDRPRMIQRAKEAVTVGKPGGGYILSTACSVAPGVEPWKMELLVEIAEEYGRYDAAG
jgi:uroporphyrinogen-III decarboxylase